MRRRDLLVLLAASGLCGSALPAAAQQADRIRRIAMLMSYAEADSEAQKWVAAFRATRGYTLAAAFGDETAFWRSEETSLNPDKEIIAALKPGLLTSSGPLIICSTPYARRGVLWEAYKAHWGQDGDPVLFWQGSSLDMNPGLPAEDIEAAYAEDAEAARAEYGGEFRTDLEAFISEEVLQRCIIAGVAERLHEPGVQYVGFVDPSGGSMDSMTLAIAHEDKKRGLVVLDLVREVVPPFSPEAVVAQFAEDCARYRIREVTGDHYAGEWPREQFRKAGITYRVSEETKSELYVAALPLLTSGRAELLDHKRLLGQFRGLERRTGRSGKDSVDHGPRGKDDVANAAAGALVNVRRAGRRVEPMAWAHAETTGERAAAIWRQQDARRAAPITTGRNQADEYRRHLIRCQDPRSCDNHPAHSTPAPTVAAPQPSRVIDDNRGLHCVTTPAGKSELYVDKRGLEPEPEYEQCGTCGMKFPTSFRVQHLMASARCRPKDEYAALEGWSIIPDPNNPERVLFRHEPCAFSGNTTRANLQALCQRHMQERHGSPPGMGTSG
jgi:hypothetical protein